MRAWIGPNRRFTLTVFVGPLTMPYVKALYTRAHADIHGPNATQASGVGSDSRYDPPFPSTVFRISLNTFTTGIHIEKTFRFSKRGKYIFENALMMNGHHEPIVGVWLLHSWAVA